MPANGGRSWRELEGAGVGRVENGWVAVFIQ